ncbi:RidA family protein [Streptomyces sp. QTS52]
MFGDPHCVLDSVGTSFDDVGMVRVDLATEEDFPALNSVFDETFKTPFPAATSALPPAVRLATGMGLSMGTVTAGSTPVARGSDGPPAPPDCRRRRGCRR